MHPIFFLALLFQETFPPIVSRSARATWVIGCGKKNNTERHDRHKHVGKTTKTTGKQRKRDLSEPKIQFRSYDFPDVSRFTLGMVRSGSFRLFLFFFQVLHFFFVGSSSVYGRLSAPQKRKTKSSQNQRKKYRGHHGQHGASYHQKKKKS